MKKLLALTLLAVLCMGLIPTLPIVANETAAPAPDLFAEATWEKGSFYDKPEPNKDHADIRRYTVIPCKEGETYTFKFPSANWRLYLYPADKNGSIDGNWIELKDGMEYVVTAVNGRMPTDLRITACPNPDGKISDDMWAKFDVQCYRTVVELNLFASATWEKGSFYDAATPNTGHADIRRYTTIPCEKGDKLTFKLPSTNWRLYIYPADANGSIDGNWFEIKDGMEYVITAINGRIPSVLRVTACPNPDGKISDDMWAKFDVSCFKSDGNLPEVIKEYNLFDEVEWKVGSYHGNVLHEDKGMRYAVLPCHKNDAITFEFKNNDFGLRVYYYDENGEITDFETTTITKTAEIRIREKNGKVPSELRITAYPIAGGEISDAMWEEKFDISCTKESDFITVATMNYGLWYDGSTKYVPDNKVEETLAKWKDMLDSHNADIIGGQEWLKHFDRSNKITVEEYLFGYKYAHQYVAESQNFASKLPITEFKKYYHKGSSRYYSTGYTEINGKEVFLINVHLGIEPDFNISRKAQYEEILEVLKDKEYFIMFGDFNAYTVSEFNAFKEAGYSVANGGEFGTFNTWTHFGTEHSWKNEAIDNIVVSSNIKILSVVCDRRELSDHNMLIAELQILNGDEDDTSTDTSSDTSTDTVTDTATQPATSETDTAGTDTPKDDKNSVLPIAVIVGVVVAAAAALCFFLFRKKGTASK